MGFRKGLGRRPGLGATSSAAADGLLRWGRECAGGSWRHRRQQSRDALSSQQKLSDTLCPGAAPGGWTTSLLDAPLLASYYAAAGALALALDRLWPSKAGPPPPPSPPRLLLHLGCAC